MVLIIQHLIFVPKRSAFTDDEIFHTAVRALGHFPFEAKIELLVSAPSDDVTATTLGRVLEATSLDHPALFRKLAASGIHPLIGRLAVEQRHKTILQFGAFLFSQNRSCHHASQGDRHQKIRKLFHVKK